MEEQLKNRVTYSIEDLDNAAHKVNNTSDTFIGIAAKVESDNTIGVERLVTGAFSIDHTLASVQAMIRVINLLVNTLIQQYPHKENEILAVLSKASMEAALAGAAETPLSKGVFNGKIN